MDIKNCLVDDNLTSQTFNTSVSQSVCLESMRVGCLSVFSDLKPIRLTDIERCLAAFTIVLTLH